MAALLLAHALSIAGEAPRDLLPSYRIDPATARVSFELGATLHTVRGRTTRVQGDVFVRPGTEGSFALEGIVRIDAASLDTGNARRDRKMRRECLEVDRYPEIVFSPTRLRAAGLDRGTLDRSGFELTGRLTIRDITQTVTIPVTAESSAGRLLVDGSLEIAWADYGVPDPSVLVLRIEPRLRASFHAELVAAPSSP